jgi:nitrate/TMAO reductase-like tetraheme cytochrome c subunit
MKLKRDFFFALLVLGVVSLLYFLSTKTKIKALPANEKHQATMTRSNCLTCHTAETLGALELQHKHPGKWKDARVECTLCHKPAVAAKAQLPLDMQRAADLASSLRP